MCDDLPVNDLPDLPACGACYLQEITRSKGIAGIWDGFFPWGTVQAVAKGVGASLRLLHVQP